MSWFWVTGGKSRRVNRSIRGKSSGNGHGAGNGQVHRDPPEVRVKVVSRKRMEEIRMYLRGYPLTGRDGKVLRHEPNVF